MALASDLSTYDPGPRRVPNESVLWGLPATYRQGKGAPGTLGRLEGAVLVYETPAHGRLFRPGCVFGDHRTVARLDGEGIPLMGLTCLPAALVRRANLSEAQGESGATELRLGIDLVDEVTHEVITRRNGPVIPTVCCAFRVSQAAFSAQRIGGALVRIIERIDVDSFYLSGLEVGPMPGQGPDPEEPVLLCAPAGVGAVSIGGVEHKIGAGGRLTLPRAQAQVLVAQGFTLVESQR